MTDEIKKIIEKHLPAEVGKVLKEQLQELEDLRKGQKTDEKTIQSLHMRVGKLEDDNGAFKSLKEWEKELDDRNNAITAREKASEIELLKKDIECQKEITGKIESLTNNIFRNIHIRKNIYGNTGPHTISHDETEDKE